MSNDPEGSGGGGGHADQTHVTTAVGGTTVDGRIGDPFLEKASQALMVGDWTAAEDAFAEGIAVSPLDARLHGGLALVAIHAEDWSRAVSHGRQAAALPGASVEIHNNLGWCLEQRGDEVEALSAFRNAFEIDPTRPEPIHHLVRLGEVPLLGDEEEGPPVALETLQRLELYEHLAGFLQKEAAGNNWRGTYVWAMERGAPWGRLATWLLTQGAGDDRSVLEQLARRDEHLAQAVISGILIGNKKSLERSLQAAPGVQVIGMDDDMPELIGDPMQDPALVVRLDPTLDRAQVPAQRTHAGVVFSLLTGLLDEFGDDAAAALLLDPAAHLGPRRIWLLSPISEAEVVGTWTVEDEGGAPVDDVPVPDGGTVRSDRVLLSLPGLDPASLESVVNDHGLAEIVRASAEGGGVIFDADRIEEQIDGWRGFLKKVARWLPEGHRSFAVWRDAGQERLAILSRTESVQYFRLMPAWPADQVELDLPVATEVQLLGRALFQSPRSGRFLGTRE